VGSPPAPPTGASGRTTTLPAPRASRAPSSPAAHHRARPSEASGVGEDVGGRRVWEPFEGSHEETSARSAASASSDDTSTSGIWSARARPLATASPTRSPVKLPGPAPHAIAARSDTVTPVARKTSSHSRNRLEEWRAATFSAVARQSPSGASTATRAHGVEVSKASIGRMASQRGSRKRTTSFLSASATSATTNTMPT